jgi:hypothetical protein
MRVTKTEVRSTRTITEFSWDDIQKVLTNFLNQTGFEDLSGLRFEHGLSAEGGRPIVRAICDEYEETSPLVFPDKEQSGRELWCKLMGAKNGATYRSSNQSELDVYESLRNMGWHWSASKAKWIDTN